MAQFTQEDYQNPQALFHADTLGEMTHQYLSDKNYKQSQQKSKERKNTLKFYPSSLALSDRDIVLSMMGYIGEPQSGKSIMIMENGTGFHNRIEGIFEDMGIMIAPELSLKDPTLKISGRSDAIVWNYLREEDAPDGEVITLKDPQGNVIYEGPENYVLLVEFKSISEKGFYNLRKSKPKDAHEEQLQLYFYLTGITQGVVLYENKNNQEITEYVIDRDEEIITSVKNRIKRLLKKAEDGEVPEPEGTATDIPSQFSKYYDMTFPNSNPFDFTMLFQENDEPPF